MYRIMLHFCSFALCNYNKCLLDVNNCKNSKNGNIFIFNFIFITIRDGTLV